jgi:hypothetical protein
MSLLPLAIRETFLNLLIGLERVVKLFKTFLVILLPKIQKQLCEACAKETSKAILYGIGNKNFSILIDESRDAFIKEQMAIIVRLAFLC